MNLWSLAGWLDSRIVEKKRYVQYQQWHIVVVFVEYGPEKLQQGAKCDLIALQNRIIWTADFC